jgi:hypothetical protein
MNIGDMIPFFSARAILAGKNTEVAALNAKILDMLPGDSVTYRNADCIPGQANRIEEGDQIPVEVLNTMNFPGMALHETTVKIGAPIILIRNIDPSRGLIDEWDTSDSDADRCSRSAGYGNYRGSLRRDSPDT